MEFKRRKGKKGNKKKPRGVSLYPTRILTCYFLSNHGIPTQQTAISTTISLLVVSAGKYSNWYMLCFVIVCQLQHRHGMTNPNPTPGWLPLYIFSIGIDNS